MRNRYPGLLAAIAVVAFVAASAVNAGDEIHFGYKFEKGSTQSYSIKFNQELDFGQFAMSALVDMEVTENCIEVSDTAYTIQWTFDKVEASRVMFENLQTDPMTDNLAGKQLTFLVDATGEVSDVKPFGYIEGWSDAEQTVTRIIESCFPSLPNKAVAMGKDWSEDETDTSDEGTKFTSHGKYVYKENKKESGRDCAMIEGEIALEIGGQVTGPQGAMEADGTGKGGVEIYFDAGAGVVVRLKGTVDINMTMSPIGGGDSVETSVGFETEKKLK